MNRELEPDFERIMSMLEYKNSWEADSMKLEAAKLRTWVNTRHSPAAPLALREGELPEYQNPPEGGYTQRGFGNVQAAARAEAWDEGWNARVDELTRLRRLAAPATVDTEEFAERLESEMIRRGLGFQNLPLLRAALRAALAGGRS